MRLRRQKPMIGRKTPRPFRWAVMILAGLISFALYWSHLTIVPEIVRASGQIAPLGQLRTIGHFDGGVFERAFVRPGDVVNAGDPIAVIRQPDIQDDIARTSQRMAALEKDAKRLETLLTFLKSDGSQVSGALSVSGTISNRYQTEQMELYLSRKTTLEARVQRAVVSFETTEKVAEKMKQRIDLARQRKSRAQDRYDRGLTTVADLDRETDRLDQVIAEALQADLRTLDARDRYHESLAAVEDERQTIEQDFTSELHGIEAELERLRTELALNQAREQKAQVVAGEAGVIQSITYTSKGEIVPPGAEIATLLPAYDQLIARVRITPMDIGHIEVSTPARIALTTFDVRRYGYLDGHILSISPTSELNERDEPFYDVIISLDKTALEYDGGFKQVRAGMEVSAEFRTESRSLLDYFIGPVESSLRSAFTESN